MSEADLNFEIPLFVDQHLHAQVAVMAEISEEEFAWAQIVIPNLIRYPDYQDWLDHREGFLIGLSMAGVDVNAVPVALVPFLFWCRLARVKPSERTLDEFALAVFRLRKPPAPVALAAVREDQFRIHAGAVEALGAYPDYSAWALRRAAAPMNMAEHARLEFVPIDIDDFIAWSRCVGVGTSESSLDRYAALVLDFLIQDPRV
jgi:hypothetical protein